MAITLGCSVPKQGKSYASIKDKMLPALAKGQLVVTNVEGLGDPERVEKIRLYLEKHYKYSGPVNLSFISHNDLERMTLFPLDTKRTTPDGTRIFDDSNSAVKMGCLLVWDEASGIFSKGAKLPDVWARAFEYHAHWTGNGHATDLHLICHRWENTHPDVAGMAEVVYEYIKRAGGKKYWRRTYTNAAVTVGRALPKSDKTMLQEGFPYEPEIWAMYKGNADGSDANVSAKEAFWQTDYFKKKIKLIVVMLVLGVVSTWWAVSSLMQSVGIGGEEEAASAPAGGRLMVAQQAAEIVGRVPAADGDFALVRVGDDYQMLPIDAAGDVHYQGEVVRWPAGF